VCVCVCVCVLRIADNYVACEKLLEVLKTKLVESNTTKKVDKNREHAVADVLKILPSLQHGLDVNVKFARLVSYTCAAAQQHSRPAMDAIQ
jgi:hypothetical protein